MAVWPMFERGETTAEFLRARQPVWATPACKSDFGVSDEQIDQYTVCAVEITPLGRTGSPDEFATSVSLLASEDASYITGIELFVDGGQAQV
jgi:NAD(P)-dependent dehydrogenase (short-subunit alcohol dehydrogenase family)